MYVSSSLLNDRANVRQNDDKNCPCATLLKANVHPADEDLITAQQAILGTIAWSPAPTPTDSGPNCVHGADPHGGMSVSPTEWCACQTTATYPVASGTNPCPDDVTKGSTISFATTTASSTTSAKETSTCLAKAGNPVWQISKDDILKASIAYCDKKKDEQDKGAKVANNWPGTCSWVFDNDVKKMSASFSAFNKCDGTVPIINPDQCKDALAHAINDCPADDDKKTGGRFKEDCMLWSWAPMPYANAGYPCIGHYNGVDKPPTRKRAMVSAS